jgi:hypothetical protein
MNNRKPGEKFSEEAKPFVEQVKEMAAHNYQKLLSLSHDLGQKLQKTFNPTPTPGGTTTGSKKRIVKDTEEDGQKD